MSKYKVINIIMAALLHIVFTVMVFQTPVLAYDDLTVTIPLKTSDLMAIYLETLDGTPEQVIQVNGDGAVVLNYSEPGEYDYFIRQVPLGEPRMQYDRTVWEIQITVLTDTEDRLYATTVISDPKTGEKPDDLSFINVPVLPPEYEPETDPSSDPVPEEPEPEKHIPVIGDIAEWIVDTYYPTYESRINLIRTLSEIFGETIEDPETPQATPSNVADTGDLINIFSYMIIFAMALLGLIIVAVVLIIRRKRKGRFQM